MAITGLALLFIMPAPAHAAAAFTITNDSTGGDCASFGTWDFVNHSCTMNVDVSTGSDGIVIAADGIMLDGAHHTLTGSGAGNGIYFSSRTGVTVKDLIVKNYEMGIVGSSSDEAFITGNSVSGITIQGIYLSNSTNCDISGNTSESNYGGISLWQSNSNVISYNITRQNYLQGIWLSESSNNTVRGNQTSNNGFFGIVLDPNARSNTIDSNLVRSNATGIRLWISDGNVITNNTISNVILNAGIDLNDSNDNQIIHNNFLSNDLQAVFCCFGPGNSFSDAAPGGGNYWGDWTSPDNNNDGFVDYAYEFMGGRDELPFTTPLNCGKPDLALATTKTSWNSYADYMDRILSVEYEVDNRGTKTTYSAQLTGSSANNGVICATAEPVALGIIPEDASKSGTLKYLVPNGVVAFIASINASAEDGCGIGYIYP